MKNDFSIDPENEASPREKNRDHLKMRGTKRASVHPPTNPTQPKICCM